MAGNYVPINQVYANTFADSIFHSENDLKLWLETEKERYGVTGPHIADNPQAVHALWQASQDNNIDPMVLVTKLQQENGLLSHAYTQQKLDYALGYGAYDCPGGGTSCWDSQYQGFSNQVENAANRIAELRDEFNNCTDPSCKTITIDGNTYIAETAADYIGYTYTPHEQGALDFNNTLESREKTYDMLKDKLELSGVETSDNSWDDYYNTNSVISKPKDPIYEDTQHNEDAISQIADNYNQQVVSSPNSNSPNQVHDYTNNSGTNC